MTETVAPAPEVGPGARGSGGDACGPELLAGLNPEQREAVECIEGAVLVLAGAGTGKTRVLTTRLAHILRSRLAWPSQTLTVTFTNKAAREMRARAAALIGPGAQELSWLGTFHSVSARILRIHAEAAGLKSSAFTILDADDQLRLCKQTIEAARLDGKRWPPRFLAALIDGWKNRALTPENLPEEESARFADGRGRELYQVYQQRLEVLNACDFGDLPLRVIGLMREVPDALAEFHRRFRYILVDEYQDTNVAQYLWLRLLAQGSGNICCVGDDDQSIYGWRGAEVENILRFEKDFPGARVIRLERNYRSTGHILGAASHLIGYNRARLGKTLRCEGEDGHLVNVVGLWDDAAEARHTVRVIEDLRRRGGRYADCAVLVRASWQMRSFEECFIARSIPYRVVGGPRFYERAEIRDALAYLRLANSPDDDLAFERVVNVPRRGVGETSMRKLRELARERDATLFHSVEAALAARCVGGAAARGLQRFAEDVMRWAGMATGQGATAHVDLARTVLDESGYTGMWQADRSPQAQTRLDNLKELVRVVGEFDSLPAFLEHVQLVMDTAAGTRDEDQVQITTLHSAKGLEWPCVFLPGWEEEVFPSRRSLENEGQRGLEEERRLAHVGLTRARRRAVISFVANRRIHGRWQVVQQSRFVDELPPEHVARESIDENAAPSVAAASVPGGFDAFGARRQATRRRRDEPMPRAMPAASGPRGLAIGQRVEHKLFGPGRVVGVDGERLQVAFDHHHGVKKLVASFVSRLPG